MKVESRRGILYLAFIGIESCWIYVLLSLMNNQIGAQIAVSWLMLILPVAFIINRILPWRRRLYLYPVNGVVLAIATLVMIKAQLFGGMKLFEPAWLLALPQALKPALFLIGSSVVLWCLGWRLARVRVSFPASVTEFQFGLTLLLVVFLVSSLLGSQLTGSTPITLVFFFLSLAGMGLSRNLDAKEWSTGAHRWFWSGFLIAGIGLILILGVLIGSLVTHNFIELILVPFKWVAGVIVKGMLFLANLLPEFEGGELPTPTSVMPDISKLEAEEMRKALPEWLRIWLPRSYVVFLGVLLLAFVWNISSRVLRWLRPKLTTAGAEIEPMPGIFKQDFISFLKRILFSLLNLRFPWWRRKKLATISPEITTPVRQIYREFLNWTTKNVCPRHLSHTPYEYLHLLETLQPQVQARLRFITEEYVKARYSLWLPSEEELRQLKEIWRELRQTRLIATDNKSSQEVALNG